MKENWQQVKEIFGEALGLETHKRSSFIIERCNGDKYLEEEVKSLLFSYDSAQTFLEKPAIYEVADTFVDKNEDKKERLSAGSFLAHYKILERIGKGGMGEVYLAEDTKLERKVALKVLNDVFDREHINLKRFILEAKAASGLSHPNIVVIHEVGDSDGTHYIVSEYIKGQTLNSLLHKERISLSQITDVATQILSALDAAHRAGIIHRDIKPDNIMLRHDGLVKILDFGLAKLIDNLSPEARENEKTREFMNTRSGMILGTTNYMSPEQARGSAIDTRTDIWSFGIVLYELLSGRLPFHGDTPSDIIAEVLRAEPDSFDEKYDIPEDLQGIVFKCLQKNPADRYQKISEVAEDLKIFKTRMEILSNDNTFEFYRGDLRQQKDTNARLARNTADDRNREQSDNFKPQDSSQSYGYIADSQVSKSRFPKIPALSFLAVTVFSIIGYTGWTKFAASPQKAATTFDTMQMSKITYEGNATGSSAVSPDGKYVAYSIDKDGKEALVLRQIEQNGFVEIVEAAPVEYATISFSPDGNSLFYISRKEDQSSLYKISTLGGLPRKIADNLTGSFTLSPDGKQVAFDGESEIFITDTNGDNKRTLVELPKDKMISSPAWRPDGKTIAVSIINADDKRVISEVNVSDGSVKKISAKEWFRIYDIEWLSDQTGLIVSAKDSTSQNLQIWNIAYPDGGEKKITNDLNIYSDISLTQDGKTLVTVKNDKLFNIWKVSEGKTEEAERLTFDEDKDEGVLGAAETSDGKIIYTARTSGAFDLWSVSPNGKTRTQLTNNQGSNVNPTVSADGQTIIFASNRSGNYNLWQMNIDGSSVKMLTDTPEDNEMSPVFADNSDWVYFQQTDKNGLMTVHKLNVKTNQTEQVTKTDSYQFKISPDGKKLAFKFNDENTEKTFIGVISNDGGEIKKYDFPKIAKSFYNWSADGKSLIYLDSYQEVDNLWSQSLNSDSPKQITFFESGKIAAFRTSVKDKTFILSRGNKTSDVIQIGNFK